MGWIIMGAVLVVLLNKSSRCGGHSKRACKSRRYRRRQSASDFYRDQAAAEDMSRRMFMMDREIDYRDDRLRRDFRNL